MENAEEYTLHCQADTKAANEALASMRDEGGRWWIYLVSHATFELVVGKPLGDDNVVLSLQGCDHIAGPTEWQEQKLEVIWEPSRPREFVIQDRSVGFKAVGKGFAWKRNFDLLAERSLYLGRIGI